MFDKAGSKLAQIRIDITDSKHDLERMYKKAGIDKPAMVWYVNLTFYLSEIL